MAMMGGMAPPPAAQPATAASTAPAAPAPSATSTSPPASTTAAPAAKPEGTVPAAQPTTVATAAPVPAPASGPVPPAAYQYPPFNMADMMQMFRPYGGMTPAAPAAPAPAAAPIDPKVKYAVQLAKMKEMGFINEEVNLDALKATNGIIDAAIERIINMLK